MINRKRFLGTILVALMLIVANPMAEGRGGGRGGGGGGRGGGGMSRGGGSVSRGGGGSIGRSGGSARSSARPSGGAAARPSGGGVAARPSGGGAAARPSVGGGAAGRPSVGGGSNLGSTYRPANMGSVTQRPAGPAGGAGKTWEGPRGGTWGAAQGPGGGTLVGHQRPGGGGSAAVVGPGGARIGGVTGPGGGTAGRITGPGGGTAGRITGAGGGTAGRITGPGGGSAAGFRGPQGGAGGVVRGPGGGAIGGAVGPGGGAIAGGRTSWGGGAAISNLPSGATNVNWHGGDYWHDHGHWWRPGWIAGALAYWPIYPPVGWFTPSISYGENEVTTVVIDNSTYYETEGVYYEKTTQDGQEGYAVVAEPQQAVAASQPNAPNPFDVLKNALAFIASQQQFTMEISDTYDEVAADGTKVSYKSHRDVYVRRPRDFASDYQGDDGQRRVFFDGAKVTLIDRTKKAYTQIAAPATIDAALDKLAKDYGITVAAAELLRTDLYDRVVENIQTGQYLGKETVGVVECDHLGFVTPQSDIEVWFQTGDKPFLRKLSIAYKNVPSRPRYTMLIPKFETTPVQDYVFKADIPEGFQQVNPPPLATQPAATAPAGTASK